MDPETGKPRSNEPQDEVIVRKARPADIAVIYNIMRLEIFPDNELPSVKQLLEDGFEGPSPWFHVLLAEKGGEAVGAAVYYRCYWSWTGRTVCLRGLRVRRSAQRRGVGVRLFRELCRLAIEENAQLEWSHAANNSAATAFFAQFNPNVNQNLDGIYMMRIPSHTSLLAKDNEVLHKDVSIRMALPEDMEELNMMIHEISAFQELADGPELEVKDLVEDSFACSPPWFFALVASRRGSVVGAVMGNRSYHSWSRSVYLQSLYVRPSARRCGIADLLVVEFNRVAREGGAEYVDFHVAPENAPAMALYEHYRAVRLPTVDIPFRLNRNDIKAIITNK